MTVNKAEVDVFLELSCFFNDPTDVDNLISGSSAFSKSNLKVYWVPQEEQNSPKSMGQGDLLEKGMATHSSSLAATPDSPKELYKNDLHDQDNHDGMIAHLEPDILECEVKLALESITTNRASRGDGIPVELFQILKDVAVKVLHSICQQIWKTQQWPQDW